MPGLRSSKILFSSVLVLSCFMMPIVGAEADTKSFSRTVVSGKATRIARYYSWHGDDTGCKSGPVHINILTKPAHGILMPHVVTTPIASARSGRVGRCSGVLVKALQVDYKSKAGYQGADTFSFDVIFSVTGRRDTDTYTVEVQ